MQRSRLGKLVVGSAGLSLFLCLSLYADVVRPNVTAAAASGISVVTNILSMGAASATPGVVTISGIASRATLDSNVAGANLVLAPGVGTGTAVLGNLILNRLVISNSSGTAAQTVIPGMILGGSKIVTKNQVTTVAAVTVATNTAASGLIQYSCETLNGAEVLIETGNIAYNVINKGDVISNNAVTKYGNRQDVTAGTFAITWTITAANPALIQVNCNPSGTPSAGYPIVTYNVYNLTRQQVVLQ